MNIKLYKQIQMKMQIINRMKKINKLKKIKNKKKNFLGLITRCKDEFFIEEFCNYYLSQGVDKIFIIDDNSNDKTIYKNLNNKKIKIIYEKNIIKNNYANKLYHRIRNNFIWIIYCDVDEFITTKRNISKTIREELMTTFKNVDCIKIPWVMMSCNKRKKNPSSILLENIYRWNHNNKHPHKIKKFRCRYNEIEVKCIFKASKFKNIWDHFPKDRNGKVNIVNGINKTKKNIGHLKNPFYKNLREIDIKNGFLLCYHYRIISEENNINKLKNNLWYKQNGYTLEDLMSSDNSEILDETLKYKKIDNSLKYVHITKTSGTYIEKLGLSKYIKWGKNDIYLKSAKLPVNSNPSYWHLPLKLFPNYPYYNNVTLFTIVRNPYNRILSECLCKYGGKFSKRMKTKQDLNNYINKQVRKASNIDFHHFLPQHLYTHDNNGKQIIDYIIKYEEIEKFNELMKKYKINIRYILNNNTNKIFNIEDISQKNIDLINKIYHLDFVYYNYKKL